MVDTPGPGAPEDGDPPPGAERPPELRKGEARVLTGVCSGLGAYSGADPMVWRTAFALTAFAGGTGVLLYIAAWMLMRDTGGGPSTLEQMLNRAFPSVVVLKLLALGLAAATAASLVGGFGWGTLVLATPLIIGLLSARNRGVDLRAAFMGLRGELRRSEPAPPVPEPEPAPSYYNPAQPWASASPGPVDLAVVSERTSRGEGAVEEDEDESPEDGADHGREGSAGWPLAAIVWWLMVAVAALAPRVFFGWGWSSVWSAEAARLLVGPDTGVFFVAGALALVGVLSIVGTWWGDTSGLWFLGVLLTVLAVAASISDLTRVGSAVWEPRTVAELEEEHRLTVGSAVLDLRGLRDLEPGDSAEVEVAVNGHTEVILPEHARVELVSRVGLGGFDDGSESSEGRGDTSGIAVEVRRVYEPLEQDSGAGEGAGPPEIEVRTDSYVGHVEVRHGRAGN